MCVNNETGEVESIRVDFLQRATAAVLNMRDDRAAGAEKHKRGLRGVRPAEG